MDDDSGTLEKVYRLNDPKISPTMGAVLAYYAFRSYYMDGRCAWPSLTTVAKACFCDEKTVRRALARLCEIGYMRLSPDQSWNVRDTTTGELKRRGYRSKVYDVLVENFASMADEGASERAGEMVERQTGQNAHPDENVESMPIPQTGQNAHPQKSDENESGHPVPSDRSECPTTNKRPTSNPSLPTGKLPAGGKRIIEEKRMERVEDASADVWRVMDRLASVRSGLALSTSKPTGRDFARTSDLIGRVTKANGDNHAVAMALIFDIIDWLPANTHWLGRVDSARHLADNWEGIANDWTIVQIKRRREHDEAARNQDRKTVDKRSLIPDSHSRRHTHSLLCKHVIADMRPHEDEYSHEGSLRYGKPSEWQTACMRHADKLNRRDGIKVTE